MVGAGLGVKGLGFRLVRAWGLGCRLVLRAVLVKKRPSLIHVVLKGHPSNPFYGFFGDSSFDSPP